jgi:hypothetical protein
MINLFEWAKIKKMIKKVTQYIFIFLLVGCVSAKPRPVDVICGALKEFANSHDGTQAHSIILKTCWGCGDSLGWIHCESFDYEPGIKLCSVLLKSAQIEYAQDNLDRSIQCLADKAYYPIQNALVEKKHIIYNFVNVEGISDNTYITIEFDNNNENELPTLIIEVSGVDD